MKRLLPLVVVILLMSLLPVVVRADTYGNSVSVTVYNNSTAAYGPIGVLAVINNTQLNSYGYINSTGLNTNVQEAGTDKAYAVYNAKLGLFSPSFAVGQSRTYSYLLGDSPGHSSLPIVPGYSGGYITTPDVPALEPGAAFTLSVDGYVDTAAATVPNSKLLVYKESAFNVINDASGQIKAGIVNVETYALTHTADAAWDDVDVSALVPSTATGVVLEVMSTTGTERNCGFRKNGSTDSQYKMMTHAWVMVGLDANKIFEMKEVVGGDLAVYLRGYTYGSGITFNTNATDISLGAFAAWTNIDLSIGNIVPAGTVGVIVEVVNVNAGERACGLRKDGSTDARANTMNRTHHAFALVGIDPATRILEGYAQDTDVNFYLVGYVTSGATFATNATDKSLAGVGAWTDVDCNAQAPGANFLVFETIQAAATNYGFRKNGVLEARYEQPDSRHVWSVVQCDGNQIVEAEIENGTTDSFLIGYFTSGIGGTYPTYTYAGSAATVAGITPTAGEKLVTFGSSRPLLSFDGAGDYVTISAIQPMAVEGTIEVWAYMANWADGVLRDLFDTSQAGGDHRILLRKQADNTPNFYMATTTTQVNIIGAALSGSGWKHWVVRYKVNDCSLYVDNTLIGTDAACVMPSFIAGQGTRLGSSYDASGAFWNGLMGTARLFDRALIPSEITDLYNGVVVTSGLVSDWRLNEGVGVTAYDGVGTSNGVVSGATWTTGAFGLSLYVDAVVESLTTFAPSVPDNDAVWTWDQNDVMPYVNSIIVNVGGGLPELWYQSAMIVDPTNIVNLMGVGGTTGILTYGTNPTGFEITIGGVTPTTSYSSSTTAAAVPELFSVPSGATPGIEPIEAAVSGLPDYIGFQRAAASLGWTTPTLYGVSAFIVAIVLGVGAIAAVGSFSVGGILFSTTLAMASGVGYSVGTPILPWWLPFISFLMTIFLGYLTRWA